MPRWLLVTLLTVLVTGCYNAPPRGGRTPYPPGPLDTVNILLRNDYSRLCPERYDYCRAGKRSICCPKGACCHDGVAPYCCDSGYDTRDDDDGPYDDRDRDRYERVPGGGGPCGPDATTCSRHGVTICCDEDEGCCSDSQGLYCCRRGY